MKKQKPGKRDFDKLEQRRIAGAKLLKQGLSQAEVARRLNVSRESVRRWKNQIQAHGSIQALKKAGRAGRKSKLDQTQIGKLNAILRAGPAKAGFPSGPWTLARIAKIIRKEFGVQYHPRHVARILRKRIR